MTRVTLIHGDVLNRCGELEEGSFDAVLCDPPYGLSKDGSSGGFMGLAWDHGVPSSEVWAAVLRLLKPGAPLVAFGGTRTYHRLAVAVEDAGFEIRDSLLCGAWVYGSGFPKSLDISKALDKSGGCDPLRMSRALRHRRESAGLSREDVAKAVGCTPSSVRDWEEGRARAKGRHPESITPSPEYRERLAELLGYTEDERVVRGAGGGPRSLYETGHRGIAYGPPATPEAARWEGYGTALKPAWEPAVVAQAPLSGTFAENAMAHGVAGLNIDGGRIGFASSGDKAAAAAAAQRSCRDQNAGRTAYGRFENGPASLQPYLERMDAGRWPSNLLLCHHPQCREVGTRKVKGSSRADRGEDSGTGGRAGATYGAGGVNAKQSPGYADADGTETVPAWECSPECPVAGLDRQSGERQTSKPGCVFKRASASDREGNRGAAYGAESRASGEEMVAYGDSGGASRFYFQASFDGADFLMYHAKAASAERHIGMPLGEVCRHPTLKPISLMAYLARLLLPPERPDAPRRLLVPFAGAGSEIIGACRAGWEEVVGIELEPEHVEWARMRVEGDAPLFNAVAVVGSEEDA